MRNFALCLLFLVSVAAKTRSSTQIVLPGGLYLADVDGDSISDFVLAPTGGSSIFVAQTSFHTEGITYALTNSTISRVFSGDFLGIGKDLICVIHQNSELMCFELVGTDIRNSVLPFQFAPTPAQTGLQLDLKSDFFAPASVSAARSSRSARSHSSRIHHASAPSSTKPSSQAAHHHSRHTDPALDIQEGDLSALSNTLGESVQNLPGSPSSAELKRQAQWPPIAPDSQFWAKWKVQDADTYAFEHGDNSPDPALGERLAPLGVQSSLSNPAPSTSTTSTTSGASGAAAVFGADVPGFGSADQDIIVGDFDGDGRDEALVYTSSSGAFALWKFVFAASNSQVNVSAPASPSTSTSTSASTSSSWPNIQFPPSPFRGVFVRVPSSQFDLGDLAAEYVYSKQQLRVGRFPSPSELLCAALPSNDDLLLYDRASGTIRIFQARLSDDGVLRFSLAVQTRSGFVLPTEQVSVANVRGQPWDDVVLLNSQTGLLRFYQPHFNKRTQGLVYFSQSPGPLSSWLQPNASLPASSAPQLFWANLRDRASSSARLLSTMASNPSIDIPVSLVNQAQQNQNGDGAELPNYGLSGPDSVMFSGYDNDANTVGDGIPVGGADVDGSRQGAAMNSPAFDQNFGAIQHELSGTNANGPNDIAVEEQNNNDGQIDDVVADDVDGADDADDELNSVPAALDGVPQEHVLSMDCWQQEEACVSPLRMDALVWAVVNDKPLFFAAHAASVNRRQTFAWRYTQLALSASTLDADPDNDSLSTRYELGGLDRNMDGISDEPLHLYGASPFVSDVLVEIDYMKQDGKNMAPNMDARRLATAEMAKKGINLHMLLSSVVPWQDDLTTKTGFDWAQNFDPIKAAYFTPSRQGLFHYCVFANQQDGGTVSGRSRSIPSSDFLITLGGWDEGTGTTEEQAGTFLHELGHNLGLRHGGVDSMNYKPNHVSIMNYEFQVSGVWKDGQRQFLYSEFACGDLDEAHLNEYTGVPCSVPALGGKFQPPAPRPLPGQTQQGQGQVNEGDQSAPNIWNGAAAASTSDSTALAGPEPQPQLQPQPQLDSVPSGSRYRTMIKSTHAWYAVNTAADFNHNNQLEKDVSYDLNNDKTISVLLGAPNEYAALTFHGITGIPTFPTGDTLNFGPQNAPSAQNAQAQAASGLLGVAKDNKDELASPAAAAADHSTAVPPSAATASDAISNANAKANNAIAPASNSNSNINSDSMQPTPSFSSTPTNPDDQELTYEEHLQIINKMPPSFRRHALTPVQLPFPQKDDVDASWAFKKLPKLSKRRNGNSANSRGNGTAKQMVVFRSVLGSVRNSRRRHPYHQRLPLHQAVLRSDELVRAGSSA